MIEPRSSLPDSRAFVEMYSTRSITGFLSLCSFRFSAVRKAYASLSLPSTLTVEPIVWFCSMRSASADMSKSWESTSKSWRSSCLTP